MKIVYYTSAQHHPTATVMTSLTHGSSDDWQRQIEVVEDVRHQKEVHVATMSRHQQYRVLVNQSS